MRYPSQNISTKVETDWDPCHVSGRRQFPFDLKSWSHHQGTKRWVSVCTGEEGGLGWRASDQLVLAAMFAGALLCVSFLPSNVGVTDTSPIRNSTAIDFGSYRSFNDLRSLKAIPACKFRKYNLATAY